ncbi:hypothetical protein FLM48_19975 [Shewanella sp. Scap07]|uniref:hypothetical protein n=1 Tax=Shewanella sp. Scap07 TaxID=2589987 RepID=UPI0015C19E80|nr:hypothetical protein [Shewanella sp. Scap07]QLE87151.1 hypothetical protein FLM48_19975 [Shewanella sp. Scap07]
MSPIEPSYISLVSAYLFFGGCLLGFIWIIGLFYFQYRLLPLVEDVLDDGVRFYTLNIFFSCLGVLQYATIFLSSFHAKRYGMLEKRKNISNRIQKLFIVYFLCFVFILAALATSIVIHG